MRMRAKAGLGAMLTAAAIGLAALPATAQAAPSTLYVFGDSLSDNGNLYAYTGQPNPVTGGLAIPVAPPYAQGGFTNGPNYAERLWDALGFAGDLAPVVLGGTNYAVGGARSRYHTFDVGAGGLPVADPAAFASLSLTGQMDRYSAAASAGADSSALYLVWAGANDLQDVLQLALTQGAGAANVRLGQAVADVVGVIGDLVALGARQLLVPTVPDIGAMPVVAAIGVGAQQVARQYSLAFNQAIDAALQAVTGTPDLELLRFDAFGLLDRVAQEPAANGFINIADACLQGLYLVPTPGAPAPTSCSNPDQYLFWDIVHPSASAHGIIGREMYADVRAAFVPEPASPMLMLAAVLALLASRARRWKPQAMPAA